MTSLPPFSPAGDPSLAASARIRRYCGWHIWPSETASVDLDGEGGRCIFLPSLHVTAVTSVIADGVTLTDYQWSENGVMERICWPTGRRNITVNFVHGYDNLPDDLADVAARVEARGPIAAAGVKSKTMGSASVTYGADLAGGISSDGFAGDELLVLDSYRIPNRP